MSKQTLAKPSWEGNSLTKSAFWLMLGKTFAFAFSFALPLLLVRRMSQTDFGLYKQCFLIINTAITVFPVGFAMNAFYFLPRESARKAQVILNILLFYILIGLLVSLPLIFRPSLLAAIFNAPDLVGYGPLIGVVVLLWVIPSFLEIIAVANGEASLAAAFIVTAHFAKAALLLAAALLFSSLRALIYAAVVQGLLQTTVVILYLNWRFTGFWRKFDWSLMRSQLSYALPLGLAGFLYALQMDLHHYFVSNRFGAAAYAIYAVGCFQLPFFSILKESVSSVIIARVSYLRNMEDRRGIIILLIQMTRKLALLLLPAYLFLLLFGHEFLTVLFTAQYLGSWPIFAINLTFIPIGIVASASDSVVRAYPEHLFFVLRIRIALFAALLIGLWFGIEKFRPVDVISSVVAVYLVEQLIIAFKVGRILEISWDDLPLLKDLGKITLAVVMAGSLAALVHRAMLETGPFSVLATGGGVFALAYMVSILLLEVLTSEELQAVRRVTTRLRRCGFKKGTVDSPLGGRPIRVSKEV